MVTQTFLNDLSYKVIGCAIEVHKQIGPGLLESVYQECMKREFSLKGVPFESQLQVPLCYKGIKLDTDYRLDFLINDAMVVELKAVEGLLPIHEAQLLTYMRLLTKAKGALINFNCLNIVKEGTRQMVNEHFRELEK